MLPVDTTQPGLTWAALDALVRRHLTLPPPPEPPEDRLVFTVHARQARTLDWSDLWRNTSWPEVYGLPAWAWEEV